LDINLARFCLPILLCITLLIISIFVIQNCIKKTRQKKVFMMVMNNE